MLDMYKPKMIVDYSGFILAWRYQGRYENNMSNYMKI